MGTPRSAIVELKIRDFRGIKELDLDFRGPDKMPNQLVVLAGPNGCGKTAVLEAALILAGGHALTVNPRGPFAVRKSATDYWIEATFATGQEEVQATDTAHSDPPGARVRFWYFSSWRAPDLIGPLNVTVGRPGRKRTKNDTNRLRNVKQQLVNEAAVEKFRAGDRPLLRVYSEWVRKINESWRWFYPHADDEFLVELVDDNEERRAANGSFDLFVRRDGVLLEVDALSSGQLELFLFLAALVLNNDREGIVFIDEPELHLDPQWHRLIVRSLLRLQPKAQFILATHSPEIYSAARSYERHFLVPDDDPRAQAWVSRPVPRARA